MKTLALVNALIVLLASSIFLFIGLDFKKLSGWLIGFYVFLSGFLFGYAWANVLVGIQGGVIFVLIIVGGSTMTGFYKQHYTKKAESWLSQNENNKQIQFVTNFIKKILRK